MTINHEMFTEIERQYYCMGFNKAKASSIVDHRGGIYRGSTSVERFGLVKTNN